MEYPQGALSTLKEVDELVARAEAGEEVKLYPVSFGPGTPAVRNMTPMRLLKYEDNGTKGLSVRVNNERSTSYIDLEWRGIPKGSHHFGFLFTNYWHAYAYSLRLTEEEVTSI
jgi:hypothetical protein